MDITVNQKDNIIEMSLSGRLDTTTASDLENAFNYNLTGIKEVKFNFKNLEYISSAGLRVILGINKKTKNICKMTIINVNDSVKNVFDITGFSKILNIE